MKKLMLKISCLILAMSISAMQIAFAQELPQAVPQAETDTQQTQQQPADAGAANQQEINLGQDVTTEALQPAALQVQNMPISTNYYEVTTKEEFAAAFAAIVSDTQTTIKIMNDLEISEFQTQLSGKNIIIDLNGCTLAFKKGVAEARKKFVFSVTNNSQLTIIDSTQSGAGQIFTDGTHDFAKGLFEVRGSSLTLDGINHVFSVASETSGQRGNTFICSENAEIKLNNCNISMYNSPTIVIKNSVEFTPSSNIIITNSVINNDVNRTIQNENGMVIYDQSMFAANHITIKNSTLTNKSWGTTVYSEGCVLQVFDSTIENAGEANAIDISKHSFAMIKNSKIINSNPQAPTYYSTNVALKVCLSADKQDGDYFIDSCNIENSEIYSKTSNALLVESGCVRAVNSLITSDGPSTDTDLCSTVFLAPFNSNASDLCIQFLIENTTVENTNAQGIALVNSEVGASSNTLTQFRFYSDSVLKAGRYATNCSIDVMSTYSYFIIDPLYADGRAKAVVPSKEVVNHLEKSKFIEVQRANAITMVNGKSTVVGQYCGDDKAVETQTVQIQASPAPKGQSFLKWISDCGVTFEDTASPSTSFTMPKSEVTITAVYEDITAAWDNSDTQQGVYHKDSNAAILYTIKNKNLKDYVGSSIDQIPATSEMVKAEQGSIKISILPSYLETLAEGIHTLKIDFTDGNSLETSFVVQKAPTPPTDPTPPIDPTPSTPPTTHTNPKTGV